ncbi:MAG TPA: hypothetical protein DFI01_02105 [Bacteroidales bacterium]|nr:hypothetical protein [Bacteroidales bacterium]
MKKKVLTFLILTTCSLIGNAQTLEEIIKKQSQALKENKYDEIQTLKITGSMSQSGMTLTMTTFYKAPDKSRVVISFNGQDIIQFYDGNKGYIINPMTGNNNPQELPAEQAASMKNNSTFKSPLSRYLQEKKLTLEGTENLNNKPAFKIKAVDGGNTFYYYIDKSTWLPVKITAVSQGINIDTYQEWAEINGIIIPKVTRTTAGNIEIIINLEKVEVNIPLEDSLFKI